MDHFVPVFITKLGDIHPKRGQNIERVARRHRTLRQRAAQIDGLGLAVNLDRKSTRLNSSHTVISYAVFCLKKKNTAFTFTPLGTTTPNYLAIASVCSRSEEH